MPPTRRKSAGATRAAQSTLSFNNKSARVTKPSTTDPTSKKKSTSRLSEPAQSAEIQKASIPAPSASPEPTPVPEVQEEASIQIPSPAPRKKKRISAATSTSDRETQATKIKDAQIKKYWKAEEDARLAPRVHQQSLPIHEKILRHFDLSSQFGPCIGITRLARWRRADQLGLDPPLEVLAVLNREEEKGKKREAGELAYIDVLGGGRIGIME